MYTFYFVLVFSTIFSLMFQYSKSKGKDKNQQKSNQVETSSTDDEIIRNYNKSVNFEGSK